MTWQKIYLYKSGLRPWELLEEKQIVIYDVLESDLCDCFVTAGGGLLCL